jgi:hypothetical protein
LTVEGEVFKTGIYSPLSPSLILKTIRLPGVEVLNPEYLLRAGIRNKEEGRGKKEKFSRFHPPFFKVFF